MSSFSFLVYLNTYSDQTSTNAANLNNFKWKRDINSLPVSNPYSLAFSVAPGETKALFNGVRTISQDNTTVYSLAPIPLSSNAYNLSWVSGTMPQFRISRNLAIDATTAVTVTINGPLATFTSTGGTLFDTSSVVVGDYIVIGSQFNVQNQGQGKVLALSSTSMTVQNPVGVNEGPIVLGASFANQIQVFSSAGIQPGDTLVIGSGFSTVSQGSYKVLNATANTLQFYSTALLPTETVQTTVSLYSSAKQLIYLESDQKINVIVNSSNTSSIEPFVNGSSTQPGILMQKTTVYSLSITNNGINTANMFFASVD